MRTVTRRFFGSLKGIQNILVLPFEDEELLEILKSEFPEATIRILRKKDLVGTALAAGIKSARQRRNDLVVASLFRNTIRRDLTAIRLLISLLRGRYNGIRLGADAFVLQGVRSLFFSTYPRVVFASIVGLMFVAATYILLLGRFAQSRTYPHRRVPEEGGTVLFLRSDLAGSVQSGGSASHIRGILCALIKKGYRVFYLADESLEDLPKEVRQIQIRPLSFLGFFDEFQLIAYNAQLLVKARALIATIMPTLVYQRHSIFNFAGPIIAHRIGIPCVLEANASEVWVKQNWSRLIFRDLAKRAEQRALETADLVSVISEGAREQLNSYHIDSKKLVVIPNGVDLATFNSKKYRGNSVRRGFAKPGDILVGFIGTFTDWHGVESLYEAAEIVLARSKRVRFLLVGDGELRQILQVRAQKNGLDHRMHFTGMIPHREVPRFLGACDILVSPHKGFEDQSRFFGSPTKLFEYMAMGKAIIASDLEQIGTVIEDGRNGYHIDPGDSKGLAAAILLLARKAKLRKRLGREARSDAERLYSWEQNVESILTFLSGVR